MSPASPSPVQLAAVIDHTALTPDTDEQTVRRIAAEALEHQFAAVCINPKWVPLTASLLAGSKVAVCTVVGFPLGATTTASKVTEAAEAVDHGAEEIDMVVDIADANAGKEAEVLGQIAAVASVVHRSGARLKVILETALLSESAKELVCRAAEEGGADFVKTSTGFAGGGAQVEDIALMHRMVGGRLGIKASGGIRTYQDAVRMLTAGATRIGASASLDIVGAAQNGSDTNGY
ncbi:deoxyribose-phosphate aldolase [Nesterenkonia alba]|uniref:deoxyribose-phosphate aldolase n=1 Tax=Nesterenkonia alba TaxID=515814 RepID=UPI00048B641B|nr:deoxyribose-phosphate aldolase [Nesterenkonia alba]